MVVWVASDKYRTLQAHRILRTLSQPQQVVEREELLLRNACEYARLRKVQNKVHASR